MPAPTTQQATAFRVCQELRRHRAVGFLPRISADGPVFAGAYVLRVLYRD